MEKTSAYILSIVGIVGVVALVVLLMNAGAYNSADDSSPSNDLSGQAIKTKLSTKIKDSDKDGVPDTKDKCPGFNDKEDADKDGTPNGCDEDADGDGYYNSDETTAGTNPYDAASYPGMTDSDADGIADSFDLCEGYDDKADNDKDGTPDGCDLCPTGDDRVDTDLDGVPNKCDKCSGYDDSVDTDGDGTPDDCDLPDLVVTGINLAYINVTNDNNLTVNFTIENQGTETASSSRNVVDYLSVNYVDMTGATKIAIGYSPYKWSYSIVPGSSITVAIGTVPEYITYYDSIDDYVVADIEVGTSHTFEIKILTDSGSLVTESDESNNQYEETITLTSADLVS